jgi:ADP-ribosylglycohydrolase
MSELHDELDRLSSRPRIVRKVYPGIPPPPHGKPSHEDAVWVSLEGMWMESDAAFRKRIIEENEMRGTWINIEGIAGVIFGTAIGDALGYPVEFMSAQGIKDRFGGRGVTGYVRYIQNGVPYELDLVREFRDHVAGVDVTEETFVNHQDQEADIEVPYHVQFSDDTQMMIATFQGLLRARTWNSPDRAAEEVAAEYIAWSQSSDNNRAPGNSCMHGCAQLDRDVPWHEAGAPGSKGCGAAMRSMAYGVWFGHDYQQAGWWAARHALMTHGSSNAQASAAAVAAGVALAMQGEEPSRILEGVLEIAELYDLECHDMIASISLEWQDKSAEEVLDRFRGWCGDEAVAAAMWCFLKYPDDYRKAVLTAVNSPGDSDSLGAITGALVGARVGCSSIPERWREKIEHADMLSILSGKLETVLLDRWRHGVCTEGSSG